MDVGAGGPARVARQCHDPAGIQFLSRTDPQGGVVAVEGFVAAIMLDDDGQAVTSVDSRMNHPASARGADRSSLRNSDVDPPVKDKSAASEGIVPPPHSRGDWSVYRQVQVGPRRRRQMG